MARLAIKGHANRGKEVIEILEMLGGKNDNHCCGVFESRIYIIDEKTDEIIDVSRIFHDDYNLFTLEEFFKKFPYKVGDKVETIYGKIGIVDQLIWCDGDNAVRYLLEYDADSLYFENELQLYKEETDETDVNDNKTLLNMSAIDYNNGLVGFEIPAGYEFDTVIDNKVVLKKLKSQYPKTYDECHELMVQWEGGDCNPNPELIFCNAPIHEFCKLIESRNIYWMIAGKQMGLGKPWKPDWTDNYQKKWTINFYQGEINLTNGSNVHFVLTFPTEEMRDIFFENFKDLIEACKELL